MSVKENILKTLHTLYAPGDLIEIRIMRKRRQTDSGYYAYEHFDKCASDIAMLDSDRDVPAVYHTVNRVKKELHARAYNRIQNYAKETTTKEGIDRRVYLPIDIDPVRPPGTSSTDEMHERSIEKAYTVKEWLLDNGFNDMLVADSGNGAHLLIKIDEPNTPEVETLVEHTQKAIIQKFNQPDEDGVDIQGFADANRIWKLYGTMTRKGDEVPEMGIHHRRSKILYLPDEFKTNTTEQLKVVADMYKDGQHEQHTTHAVHTAPKHLYPKSAHDSSYVDGKWDMEHFLNKHSIEVDQKIEKSDHTMWRLKHCPFNSDHKGKDVAVFQHKDGILGFDCKHHSCEDKHWEDVRELFEPGYKARVEAYKAKAEAKQKAQTAPRHDNGTDMDLPPLEYARASLKLEDVPDDSMERISAAEIFIGSYTIEMTEAEREFFAETEVKEHFSIENTKYIRKMLSSVKKRLDAAKKADTKKRSKAAKEAARKANEMNLPQISSDYKNLAKVQENGKIKLLYPEVADMLTDKHDIIAYGGEIFVYDDGFYKNGETIVKQEITKIARAVNFEDGIKTPTEEVIHYIAYDDPCEKYPFNVRDNAINVSNGVVVIDFDKETFELVEHNTKFKFNYKFDIKFNQNNVNDTIHTDVICKYVESADVDILYQIVAQALLQMLGSAPFKKSYLLQGDPDAGKSTFLELVLQTFGQETHSQVALQDICNNRFALANLEGKLLNTYDDLSEMQLSNTGKFKAITGKEDHEIERKGKQGYTARLTAVHVYTCNTPPAFDKRIRLDTAFWGRWEYIHFPYHFERDAFFYQRMFTPENLEGFFMKILEKVIKIRKEGLQVNSTAGEVREKWSFNSDPLYQFITLNMEPSEREITLNKDEFLEAYKRWCVSTDVDNAKIIMGKKAFTIALDKYGFIDRKVTTAKYGRIKCYQGMFNWQLENKYRTDRVELKTEQGSL